MYKFDPIEEYQDIKIFIKNNLDEFKDIEQKFWSKRYAEQKITEGLLIEKNLSFHEHFLKPMIDLPQSAKILEVSCGTRGDGIGVAISEKKVIESDLSLDAVLKTRERARLAGTEKNQEFIVCDAENLPFADNTLDAAFITASLHHLPNPEKGLKEMKRVVKPGGLVIIALEPNSWPYYTIFPLLSPTKWLVRKMQKRKINSVADDTTRGFSKKKLERLVKGADLEIIDIKPVKFFLEFYDSGRRLAGRFRGYDKPLNIKLQKNILAIDEMLAKIPIIRNFPWHWNIITRKK